VLALAGSKLRPMARDLAAQKQIQAAMDLHAPASLGVGHEDIVRCIAQGVPTRMVFLDQVYRLL